MDSVDRVKDTKFFSASGSLVSPILAVVNQGRVSIFSSGFVVPTLSNAGTVV